MMCKAFWLVTLGSGLLAGVAGLHASGQPDGAGVHARPAGLHGLHGHGGAADEPCELAKAVHAHLGQVHAELKMTKAQQEAVHAAFAARHAELAGAFRPVVVAQQTLINAVHAGTPDEAAIRAAGVNLGRTVGEAAVVLARVKTDVLRTAELTPEQTRKLDAMKTNVDGAIGKLLDSLGRAAENAR